VNTSFVASGTETFTDMARAIATSSTLMNRAAGVSQ
jgi:hypothetical protein